MAAKIKIKEPNKPAYDVDWSIGKPFNHNPNQIVSVEISGDEQFLLPYPNKVHVLTGTEAILYGAYIKDAVVRDEK
jgi:hypothetical protein